MTLGCNDSDSGHWNLYFWVNASSCCESLLSSKARGLSMMEWNGWWWDEWSQDSWAWRWWFLIIISSPSDWPEPGLGLTSISLSYGNFKPKHRQFSLWNMRKIKFELSWIEHQIFIPTPAATEMWWHLVCCGLKSEGFDISGDNLHKQHSS